MLSGGEPDKRLLLYVGRLAAEKEIERLRDVLLASDDFRLAIVGDGPHRGRLESHFAGTRTVFTGFLHGERLAQAYASSDIFVFPSTTETLGLVLLEAMVSGLAVVAAASPPSREQIQEGITGFLYDPQVPGSLVNAILPLQDEELLRRIGDRAREAALTQGWNEPSRLGCWSCTGRPWQTRRAAEFRVWSAKAPSGPGRGVFYLTAIVGPKVLRR